MNEEKSPTQKAVVESLYMLRLGLSICMTCGKSQPLAKAFFNYASKI